MNDSLLNSERLQPVGKVAAGSPGMKSIITWQQMLQMTLKSALLQDDQEIWNLTSPLSSFSGEVLLVSFPLKIPSGRTLISETNTQV